MACFKDAGITSVRTRLIHAQAAQAEWLKAVQQDENFTMMGLQRRRLPGHAVPDTTWDPEVRC